MAWLQEVFKLIYILYKCCSGGTCQLDDLMVEQLFWVVTGMSPKINVKDLDVAKKQQLCLACKK